MPAPISTVENFLDIIAIPTKCGHFLVKFIGKQDSGKILCQGYHMLPLQPRFRRHVHSNFDFFNIFLH